MDENELMAHGLCHKEEVADWIAQMEDPEARRGLVEIEWRLRAMREEFPGKRRD